MRKCFVCEVPLIPVFPLAQPCDECERKQKQFHDALTIKFTGGYDEYFDNLEMGNPEVIICEACADDLLSKVPWIAHLLR